MSYKTMDWAWSVKTRSMSHKAVLQGLASMSDEKHQSHPAQEYLAAHLFCTSRTIRRLLADLEDDGLITREHRWNAEAQQRGSDEYILQVGKESLEVAVEDTTEEKVPDNMSGKGGLTGHLEGGYRTFEGGLPDTGVLLTVLNSLEHKDGGKPRGSRIPEDFALTDQMRLWAATKVAGVDPVAQTEIFKLHWESATGASATKIAWYKAWQVWMLRAQTYSTRGGSKPVPVMHAEYAKHLAKFRARGISELEFRERRHEPGWLQEITGG